MTAMNKIVDGVVIELTPDEIAAREAEIAAFAQQRTVPSGLSRRQFSQYLAETNEITWDEHFAWIGSGAIPAPIANALELIADDLTRNRAKSFLIGASTFERQHPMTLALLALIGKSESWADQAWVIGSQL